MHPLPNELYNNESSEESTQVKELSDLNKLRISAASLLIISGIFEGAAINSSNLNDKFTFGVVAATTSVFALASVAGAIIEKRAQDRQKEELNS